ncbi:MAG: hypothetical protein KZQ80_04115 [Candidatus Thiodiazotropha sp. (ex Monitilora ramsayi)]|nr:hypothetical protein [Candidatus Thiodiazotropha sp. (ex Myrtea sp. 'scaly one' KF741663)]MCU7851379.1 hypothetical protein [Candidatus Thiodiazotropha sp. (ex Monitilora ramsayi)]
MKTRSFRWIKLTLPLSALFAFPLWVNAETITGTINGHECAHSGVSCPAARLDPHISLESDFVLMVGEGDYVFMPNLSRDIKVRYVLDTVQIEGKKHPRFNSINVDIFRVKKGGKFVTVWTQKQADFEYQALYRDGLAWPGQQVESMNKHDR